MGRRRLEIGERGEIDVTPQRRGEDGKWKRAPSPRTAERWRARCRVRGVNGVLEEISRFSRRRQDAVRALEEAVSERLDGETHVISGTTPLLSFGDVWLKQIARTDSRLSQTTVDYYRQTYWRHVAASESAIRGLTLTQVNNPMRLRAFLQSVADDHGTSSAKVVKSVVSGILNLAVESGVLSSNAMRQIRPVESQSPREITRDRRRALTREERATVMNLADKQARAETLDPRATRKREAVADLVAFMIGTGVRVGEARGLRWEHVDLEHGYVRLHGTKTKGSRRRLDLPEWLVQRLRDRVTRMSDHLARAAIHAKGTPDRPRAAVIESYRAAMLLVGREGLVFPAPASLDAERAWDESNASNALRTLLDDAGLDWAVPHSFRRTVATVLGESGVPLAQIADQLGHADPSLTAPVYLGRDFDGDKSAIAAPL